MVKKGLIQTLIVRAGKGKCITAKKEKTPSKFGVYVENRPPGAKIVQNQRLSFL
jgi:hypothetical protein